MSRHSATTSTRRHNERTSSASGGAENGRKHQMNISFRMNITTSGVAAASGGLLVTTGVQTGSGLVFGAGNQNNAGLQLYDARSAENLMRIWRNAAVSALTENRNCVEEGRVPAITTSEATSLPVRKMSNEVMTSLVSAPPMDSFDLRKTLGDEISGGKAEISASKNRFAKIGVPVLPFSGDVCPSGISSNNLSFSDCVPTSEHPAFKSRLKTQRPEERHENGLLATGTPFPAATTTAMAMSCQLFPYADEGAPRGAADDDADALEEQPPLASEKPSIKLNVFSPERGGRGNAVELYVPPHYFTATVNNLPDSAAKPPLPVGSRLLDLDSEWVLNDTTTTTTTVEVFREQCGGRYADNNYFTLPPPPLSGAEAAPQLIRVDGAPYEVLKRTETRFGGGRSASSSTNKEVRWMDPRPGSTHFNPSNGNPDRPQQQQQQQQLLLPYIVREPSSIYGSGTIFHSRSASACSGGALNTTERSYGSTSGEKNINGYGMWTSSGANEATHADKDCAQYSGANRNQSPAGNYESGNGSSSHHDDDNDGTASVTTILRRQCRESSIERLVPSSRCASASAWTVAAAEPIYSRISSPSTIRSRWDRELSFETETERVKPPLPPKKRGGGRGMRRTVSQPNIIGGERNAPPRPRSRKPPMRRHPQLQPPHRRSASSNEIIHLYQTRDCLGNVLYEV